MCTFDYETQLEVLRQPHDKERALKILQEIGVFDKDGKLTPKYSFIEKYGKKSAAV